MTTFKNTLFFKCMPKFFDNHLINYKPVAVLLKSNLDNLALRNIAY